MWCPIILGLSMRPFSVGCPGPPHSCHLRSITVKAGAARTHNIWAPKGHSSISAVLFWSKTVPSQPRFRGGDTDFIYSACREKGIAAGYLGDFSTACIPSPHITLFFSSSQTLWGIYSNLFSISDMNWLLLMTLACAQPLTSLSDSPCILELISVLPIFFVWWYNLWPHKNAAWTQLLC